MSQETNREPTPIDLTNPWDVIVSYSIFRETEGHAQVANPRGREKTPLKAIHERQWEEGLNNLIVELKSNGLGE